MIKYLLANNIILQLLSLKTILYVFILMILYGMDQVLVILSYQTAAINKGVHNLRSRTQGVNTCLAPNLFLV